MQKNTLIILGLSIGFSSLTYSITPNDQLLKAAQEGDLQQAQEAVAAGADINHVYILTQSSTALHVAAFYGNKDIIKFLLDKDANVNIDNRMGFTPLHLAISLLPSKNAAYSQKNSVVIAKLLLAAGADINAKANMGDTPLHRAVTSNQVDVVQLLIKNGARTLKNYHGETALDKARENNQQDIIQILSELPTLKELSARTTRGLIGQRALTLEQLKNNIPQELYDFVVESFYNESLLEGKLSYELEDAITAHISSLGLKNIYNIRAISQELITLYPEAHCWPLLLTDHDCHYIYINEAFFSSLTDEEQRAALAYTCYSAQVTQERNDQKLLLSQSMFITQLVSWLGKVLYSKYTQSVNEQFAIDSTIAQKAQCKEGFISFLKKIAQLELYKNSKEFIIERIKRLEYKN